MLQHKGDIAMATGVNSDKSGTSRRSRKIGMAVLGKPRGVILNRVQAVGPERFGVVSVDCGKFRSKWMLADFYGKVLVGPTNVEHLRVSFDLMIQQIRRAVEKHSLKDVIVCVEMTGTYHRPIQRELRKGGFETRLVHPFATSHYRIAEHGDQKTDDHDLVAIFRAGINGFGLLEQPIPSIYRELQIFSRARRDLVRKRSTLQHQIRHHLEESLPGFAAMYGTELWDQIVPVPLLKVIGDQGGTVDVVLKLGEQGLVEELKKAGARGFQRQSVSRVVAWAANTFESNDMAASYARVWRDLLEDWSEKTGQIQALERDLVALLVQTPYVLLLSHPGINVVSASELAGEMGPIENYASANSIKGRAGLYPSRYQSDRVDRYGTLSRFRNARLRGVLTRMADSLVKCNAYWKLRNDALKAANVEGRDIRCRVANRITRSIFQIVSGRRLFDHPSRLDRHYVMEKLLDYQREHRVRPSDIVRNLEAAAIQIPPRYHQEQAKPLQQVREKAQKSRLQEPKVLGELLVSVLAKLGVTELESN
jgi:transposase